MKIIQAQGLGLKDVKTIRLEGIAAAEILHIADEENVDTIIIGSKGIKPVKEFLLGGVSDSPCKMPSNCCQVMK